MRLKSTLNISSGINVTTEINPIIMIIKNPEEKIIDNFLFSIIIMYRIFEIQANDTLRSNTKEYIA